MRTLLVSHREVTALLPMAECIDVMAEAFRSLARGDAEVPQRQMLPLGDSPNALALMPALVGARASGRGQGALGTKVLSIFPGNAGTPYHSHLGVVLLFDVEQGRLLAIMDAGAITAIRTAAVSALATNLLARQDAGDLAILGAGVQAMTHLEAMRTVRTLRRVRVWSRTGEHAQRFAAQAAQRLGLLVEVCDSPRDAVLGADLVCTVTAAREPVLLGEWLADGAHVNAVGAHHPTARELDTAAVRRARCYADRSESARREAGDFLIPMAEGAIPETHVRGELGDVLIGTAEGRSQPGDVTVFKSLGLAIEDVAAARHVYEKGVALGTGIWISLGGLRDDP